jgi:LysM repeat protein
MVGGGQTAVGQGQTRLILAVYNADFTPSAFGADKTPWQPSQPYFSSEIATMQRQINEAHSVGIDAFVQRWPGPGSQSDANFATLLNLAQGSGYGFRAALLFETDSPLFSDDAARTQALRGWTNGHANHAAYLRVDGRPVIFFAANWTLAVNDWVAIRDAVDPDRRAIWIAEGGDVAFLTAFDGLYLYNIAWSENPAATAADWANGVRAGAAAYGGYKYWVATAMPGWDDRLLSGAAPFARERANGDFYRASFSGAAASAPDMLLINSYNQWTEGSNIEPSVEHGVAYLSLTAEMSQLYKQGVSIPAPQPTAGAPPAGPPAPTPIPTPTAQPAGRIIYTVSPGDTLIGIAARFNMPVQTLYAYNDMNASSLLYLGLEIVIGYTDGYDAPIVNPDQPYALPRDDGAIVHSVQPGETLLSIAADYNLSLAQLLALNGDLTAATILQLNQQIIVGSHPRPQEVGGSADMIGGQATAAPLMPTAPMPTREISEGMTAVPPAPPAVTPIFSPPPAAPTATTAPLPAAESENIGRLLGGVVLLLALIVGLFIHLSRQR